ncbi:MAG: hypothetical protein L0Y71_11665 [Gemmataceae bacterium]|nr:hypothetical protein [Gemmataceae bacterium]
MDKALYFKNVRQDGGVHVGFSVNDVMLYEDYRVNDEAPDPALIWYVDIECESSGVPRSPEEIRRWFAGRAGQIDQVFGELIAKMEIGVDADLVPFRVERKFEDSFGGVVVRVSGSAMRRVRVPEVASYLQQTRDSWLQQLEELPPVAAGAQ